MPGVEKGNHPMLHRASARRRSIALLTGVAALTFGVPAAQAASTAYRCNGGGATVSHRCSELADANGATSPDLGALGGPISLTGNGRYTTFSTQPDGGGTQQVQLRELGTGATALVSASTAGVAGTGPSYLPAASDDGSKIAFISEAPNLVTLDANQDGSDVFVRNVLAPSTTLLTPSTSPIAGADGDMTDLTISGDGSTVAIVSFATNLVAGDTNGAPDVFVVKSDGTGMRIGSTSASGANGNDVSFKPALSDNGRYLAFGSDSTNLVPGDTNAAADVFVKDLQTNAIEVVSVTSGGAAANDDSGGSGVAISDDGRYVAFSTQATNLGAGADGKEEIVLRDRVAGTTTVIGSTGQPFDVAFPSISGDGSIVSFVSRASDLVGGDTNGAPDLFLAGRSGGITRVVGAVSATGAVTELPATSNTFPAGLSDDGTVAAFTSETALSPADDNTLTDLYVHIVDLRGPSITAPAANLVTNDATPALTATLQTPGNRLEVSEGTTVLATISTTAPNAAISTALPTLAEGSHTLSFRELDGPYASDPVTRTVTVDTAAPADVSIVAPSDGATIGNDQPLIVGTAGIADGDDDTISLTLRSGLTVIHADAAVPVAADGTWQELAPSLPSNGTYTIEVTQGDVAGNSSSDTTSFTLSAGVPTVAITSPASGATNDATVTLEGTIDGSSSVALTVLRDGNPFATPVVTAPGSTWSHELPLGADGLYAISASATNVAGTGVSNTVTLALDTLAPATPVISAPVGGVATTTPTASGTAGAGDTILLSIDDTAVLPSPIADGTGAWSKPLATLSQGVHVLKAQAEDGAGNRSSLVSASFTVDTQAPLAPTITSPLPNATLRHGNVTVIGNGEPGATVTVRDGVTTIGTATVTGAGGWSLPVVLATGAHALTAVQRDAAMQASPDSATVSFTIDPNSTLTTISTPLENAIHGARRIEIAGTGKPGGSVRVFAVDGVSETALGAAVPVSSGGSWAFTTTLNDGAYRIRARELSEGAVSSDRAFTIRSGVPVITAPAANAVLGSAFTVRGTALPGARISLRDGTAPLGTTTAGGDGAWSLAVSRPNGTRTLIAHAGDGASRTPDSDPRIVVVDSVGPTVTIAPDADLMGSLVGTPVRITGTGTDAHRIASIEVVYRNVVTGQTIRSTTATCTGCTSAASITFQDVPTLVPGMWTATVTATDEVGNLGLPASARFVALP